MEEALGVDEVLELLGGGDLGGAVAPEARMVAEAVSPTEEARVVAKALGGDGGE